MGNSNIYFDKLSFEVVSRTFLPVGKSLVIYRSRGHFSFVAESLHGVEFCGARSRVEAGDEADDYGEGNRAEDEPPRHRGYFHAREVLTFQINIRGEGETAADEPAENYAGDSSDETHHASLDEKEAFYIAIRRAKRLEDADFAAAFEDGHDQSVDNSEGGDRKREAGEKTEQQIEYAEKNL